MFLHLTAKKNKKKNSAELTFAILRRQQNTNRRETHDETGRTKDVKRKYSGCGAALQEQKGGLGAAFMSINEISCTESIPRAPVVSACQEARRHMLEMSAR